MAEKTPLPNDSQVDVKIVSDSPLSKREALGEGADWGRRTAVTLALTILTSSQGLLIAASKAKHVRYDYSVTSANCTVCPPCRAIRFSLTTLVANISVSAAAAGACGPPDDHSPRPCAALQPRVPRRAAPAHACAFPPRAHRLAPCSLASSQPSFARMQPQCAAMCCSEASGFHCRAHSGRVPLQLTRSR